MNNQKANKATFTWGTSVYHDPYEVIKEVFDHAQVGFYRSFIGDVLLYSSRKARYKKRNTGSILLLLDGMACLLQACHALCREQRHSPLEIRDSDVLNTNFYSRRKVAVEAWDDFPRLLTKAEMLDPYKALGKVFRHNDPDKWQLTMHRMVDWACGQYIDLPTESTFLVYLQLGRLFEAAHLIYIREIVPTRNWRG